MNKVTDPALLQQLNGGGGNPNYTVNQAILDVFDPQEGNEPPPAASPVAAPAAPARKKITDPALIAQLESAPAHDGRSFLQTVGDNFRGGAQAVSDLAHGNFETPLDPQQTPKTQALADKLFPEGSMGGTTAENIGDMLLNWRDNTSGDVSGAVLEKFANNPAGKAVTALGGLNPAWNAVGSTVEHTVNPAIISATGVNPDNLALAELAGGTAVGAKVGGKINDPTISAVKGTGQGIARNAGEIRAGMRARSTEELNADTSKMLNAAGDKANAMRAADVTLTPQASMQLARNAQQVFAQPENELFSDSHPVTSEILARLTDQASKGPLRLNELNNMRERLVNEGNGSDAAMAGKLRNSMMDSLQNLKQQDIASGNPQAIQSLGEFLNQWKQGKRFEDISGLINTAKLAPNEADALQRTFGRFLKDDSNHANFSPEELALMQQVAKTGMGDHLMKLMGSIGLGPNNKLIPVLTGMAMYGGGVGAVPTAITSALATGARFARNSAVRGRAENVLSAIESRDTSAPMPGRRPPVQTVYPPTQPMPSGGPPLLSGPTISGQIGVRQPNTIMVNSGGVARPQSPGEMFTHDAQRAGYENMGVTPDVVNAYTRNARSSAWDAVDSAQEAQKGAQAESMWQQNAPNLGDIIAQGVDSNMARSAATGTSNLGAIGQALLDALKNGGQRSPTRITISPDPNIGPDGLPRVNLPQL